MGIEYSKEENDKFTVNQDPIATYGGYLEFVKGDKVVGKVDATFDFRGMPEEHHEMALQMIMSGARTLCLRVDEPVKPVRQVETKKEKKKWFGMF